MSTRATESSSVQIYDHYIGGKPVPPSGGHYLPSENPYTGEHWANIARGTSEDVSLAVYAARQGFKAWTSIKANQRGILLNRLADLIETNARRLAEIEVRDNGKLYAEMHPQMLYVANWFRYFAGLCDKIEGRVVATDKDNVFNFTKQEPMGLIGMITPWNSPILLLTWKLAPAIAAGNVAIVKPSEFTSASTIEFARLFQEAGLPDGVINVVTGLGNEVGQALVDHPEISKIAFTGSDVSGRRIYEASAKLIKPVTLELGGKSPNIVFEDADQTAAVSGVISGIFAATGQTCIAGSRLLVQRSIHDEFMKRLLSVAEAARIGDPMDAATNIGPIATAPQFEKVLHYIDVARRDGATCVLGGKPYTGPGSRGRQFIEPTIFTGVSNQMRIAQEEVFGPVLAVIPFDTEEDAYCTANDTPYGLGAGVWTSDIGRALRAADALQAGTVWVNTYRALSCTSPFGGYKRSGIGREGGIDALSHFMHTKSVWISTKLDVADPFVMR